MYNDKKILGVIPARGGSKGLPGKNILPLGSRPLIEWSIKAAFDCNCIDEVLVSTDDKEIGDIACAAGAVVPFLRPAELATDETGIMDVLFHLFSWLDQKKQSFDLVMLLQPTSPLRTTEDIIGAVTLFFDKQAKAIVSVCEVDHHPFWMNELPPDQSMNVFLKEEALNTPRQQLPPHFRLNGAIYLADISWLKKNGGFLGEGAFAFIMDRDHSVDIDHKIDFQLAECLLALKLGR